MSSKNTLSKMAVLAFLYAILFTACTLENSIGKMKPPQENSFTVSFEANGGMPVPPDQIIERGGMAEEPQMITREGFIFMGWYSDAGFTKKWNFAGDTVSATITLYARWQEIPADSRLVVFNANGGTPVPAQQIVVVGEKINKPSFIAKTGYVFSGWFRDIGLTNEWNFDEDTVSAGVTLYAAWDPVKFTVLYDANGGDGVMPDSDFIYGISQKLPANAFIRTGYSFSGWASSMNGQALYTDEQTVQNLSVVDGSEITLFAVWAVNTYTVVYNSNGGSGTMANSAFTYGVPQKLRPNTFTRTGYNFSGWSKTASGPVEFADEANVSNLTSDSAIVTLYAVWSGNTYTVAYNANGGAGTMENLNLSYGVPQNLPANAFIRTGYSFTGWSRSQTGQAEFSDEASVINLSAVNGSTITLYAQWMGNSYTVSYDANGGDGAMAVSIFSYGIAQTLRPNTFTKPDCIFSGWAESADGPAVYSDQQSVINLTEMADAAVTLFAVWQSTIVPGENIAAKLSWLTTNALSNFGYTIEVNANEIIAPYNFTFTGRNNISITLKGIDTTRVIAFSTNADLFTIGSDVTLILENNITLQGRGSNTGSVIRVNSGGTLVMNSGSLITSNKTGSSGGGVYVYSGTFAMNGGTISGNTSSSSSSSSSGG
ncbi:MAG: InlB B-repeat-containing protein, partial [Treponema sp.]|nr:InlB B-repeat-containing protein [Treponema sp.]